jgi:predicted RecB family nuclease
MAKMITASMLYSYTTCPHRVTLDLFGDPADRDEVSPFVELLWERGHAFEEETIAGLDVPFLNLRGVPREQREGLTLRAMGEGEDLIYGGRISHGRLLGEPDLLRRRESGYIPGDIKSGAGVEGANEDSDGKPKRHYAVQLALYSDILQQRGLAASKDGFIWDIHGDEVAYDLSSPRTVRGKRSMWDEYGEALVNVEDIADRQVTTRPGLISECALCHWRSHCRREIVGADDLTLISELGRSTREKFPPSITTVADLASASLSDLIPDGTSAIPGIGEKPLRKYHARAVLQKQSSPAPYFTDEVRLPVSDMELFFDVETDPFRGLCYLHGFVERTGRASETEKYVAFFADEAIEEAERDAFAQAWAHVQERSDAVIYYYSHYERTIWKQLAGRYPDVATEDGVIALFEEERFVDLYTDVVRSRMIWPTYSLSLKTIAAFLGFKWRDSDPSGAGSIQWFHEWVETGDASIRQRILEYNEDDCRATRVLVDGLRDLARQP